MLMPKGGITLNTENVGTLIFKLRKEKGMTQQELADKLQLTCILRVSRSVFTDK